MFKLYLKINKYFQNVNKKSINWYYNNKYHNFKWIWIQQMKKLMLLIRIPRPPPTLTSFSMSKEQGMRRWPCFSLSRRCSAWKFKCSTVRIQIWTLWPICSLKKLIRRRSTCYPMWWAKSKRLRCSVKSWSMSLIK